jgi:hypothetical protein
MIRYRWILLPVVNVALLAACHDDGLGTHGCPTEYGDGWHNYGLRLSHVEPAGCPVFITQPGTRQVTGATVVDGGMLREMERAQLVVWDANRTHVNSATAPFRENADNEWVAPMDVSYSAGRVDLRADIADYDLFLRNGNPGPWAEMRISYTDRVVASISGPSIVVPGATHTWSASVTSGQAPFQYRWYVDWDLVGSDASYTGPAPGDTTLIRLDVTDARGEVDSHTKRVVVDYCDGAKVC